MLNLPDHHPDAHTDDDRSTAHTMIVELAQALGANGTPAHRLEEAMSELADRLDFEAAFFATPTAVFSTIADRTRPDTPPATVLTRTRTSDLNAQRTLELDDLLRDVHDGTTNSHDALTRVRDIVAHKNRYGLATMLLCVATASACGARFFGGGPREIIATFTLGLLVGALASVSRQKRRLVPLVEFLAGGLAALGAAGANAIAGPIAIEIVTLASIIALIPGLALTIAMNELATRNLVAGGARLVGAITGLVTIGFGVALGTAIATSLGLTNTTPPPPTTLPPWTEWLAVAIAVHALAVLFCVPPRYLAVTGLIGIIGYAGARLGAEALGGPLGASAGALALGAAANTFNRITRRPIALVLMPGILVLVPGAIGYRSVTSFIAADAMSGIEGAFTALLVAVSLVVGLLAANLLIPPRSAL